MAESTSLESASASYSSSSTSFAAETETVVSDCEVDSGEEAEVEAGPSTKVVSLLDRLRSPTSAEIARKRKIKANPPPKGKHRCKGTLTSDPKGVAPNQRVREFSEEPFYVHKVPDYVTMPIQYVHSMLNNSFFGNNWTEARE